MFTRAHPTHALSYDLIDFIWFIACVGRAGLKATNLIDLRKTQIYTKRGNVEMPLTGRLSDFDNAILLDKVTLIKTNALIQVRSSQLNSNGARRTLAMSAIIQSMPFI